MHGQPNIKTYMECFFPLGYSDGLNLFDSERSDGDITSPATIKRTSVLQVTPDMFARFSQIWISSTEFHKSSQHQILRKSFQFPLPADGRTWRS